ncbi:hypothetical protein Tco_1193291 [Tanacetum coccineum]
MDTTRAQQQVLDDELVAPADRLKIGKSNLRLSSILKSKEPTLQVDLDALNSLHSTMHLRSLLMYQKYTCKSSGQIFEEPPLEEEILSFIRDLGHTGEIKFLSDVNEPTLQVALDALKLTPFYNAFEISADVPEIYMQEFWVTVSRHHSSLRFKLNGKSHTVNVDNFRDMLKICPKLPGQH